MTVADLKSFSIGLFFDFFETHADVAQGKDIHVEEKKYQQMSAHRDIVEQRYKDGQISEKRYTDWMEKFTALEEKYG